MRNSQNSILGSHKTIVSILQRFADMVVIFGSLYLVNWYLGGDWSLVHIMISGAVIIIFDLLAELNHLYTSWRGLSIRRELVKCFSLWFISVSTIYLTVLFFYPGYMESTYLKLYWFISGLIGLCGYRVLLRIALRGFRAAGRNSKSVLIAGAGNLGKRLENKIKSNPALGLEFVGFYDDHLETGVRGKLEQLVEFCKSDGVDRVYIALPMRAELRIKWLLKELSDTTVSVYLVPDIFTFELLHSRNDSIDGIPTISIYDSPLQGVNSVLKRAEDIVVSFSILLLISPLLLIIATAVKLTSKGPVIFKQNRYGLDGKAIKVWKFRSMKVMENDNKVIQATKNDSRLTPIGAFIRKTSLDELPQFINVLQGKMSIVGPRPHAVAHNEEYRKLIDGYMLRHKVKPGITGWAQVNGWRGETDTLDKMERRIEFDLEYINNWSLWLDVKIIIGTIFKGFINKNAY